MLFSLSTMILYVQKGCAFCGRVLRTARDLGISLEEKDIANDALAAELLARGGKHQVPYLVDSERAIEMYESEDIIAYVRTRCS